MREVLLLLIHFFDPLGFKVQVQQCNRTHKAEWFYDVCQASRPSRWRGRFASLDP